MGEEKVEDELYVEAPVTGIVEDENGGNAERVRGGRLLKGGRGGVDGEWKR